MMVNDIEKKIDSKLSQVLNKDIAKEFDKYRPYVIRALEEKIFDFIPHNLESELSKMNKDVQKKF